MSRVGSPGEIEKKSNSVSTPDSVPTPEVRGPEPEKRIKRYIDLRILMIKN